MNSRVEKVFFVLAYAKFLDKFSSFDKKILIFILAYAKFL